MSLNVDHDVDNSTKYAIKAKNLTKTFKNGFILSKKPKTIVLDDININIEKNKIYALLGPSGCGKTTLLKCLLGLLNYDQGEVFINPESATKNNNKKLNLYNLGYMPQETCLFSELKISEIFFYFGKLYSMKNKEIIQRTEFLIDLLKLPSKNQLVSNLSGGQARRTSLAVSMLNKPKILILDEPTVGLDPMLRKKIWDFLIKLSHVENTTILITTHYIEEARGADCLGFMRNGQIIEENSPTFLMNKYRKQILEEVFYSICENQDTFLEDENDNRSITGSNLRPEYSYPNFDDTNKPFVQSHHIQDEYKISYKKKSSEKISFDRVAANFYKDSIKCLRNKKLLFIQFLVPIIQITFFCLCIGRPVKDVPIGYVNYDTGALNIGEQIINLMDNDTLNKIHFDNFNDGYQALKKGKIWSLFVVDQNFSLDISRIYLTKEYPKSINNIIHIYTDNTNQQISLAIRDTLLRAVKKLADVFLKKEGSNEVEEDFELNGELDYSKIINEDRQEIKDDFDNFYFFKFETPIYGQNEAVFTNFMAPGVALSVIFFVSVASTASNFEFEKRVGLTERIYISGVRTVELLLSQLVVYSILMAVQVFIILGLLFVFFMLPLKGSFILLIGLLLSQGFCGLSYGLSLASVFHGEETVIQVTLASFYPMLLMSGIIWPLEAQPYWLCTYVSKLLPLTYATESFRAILEKDWGLSNEKVYRGYL
ncbi:unnamed protein product, partial [Brachionus calyciflorus]